MNSRYSCSRLLESIIMLRVRKYTKFGVFYAKIVQMTPLRLLRESLHTPEIFANKHSFDLSLLFLQQIQFTLIVDFVNLN